MSSQYFQFAQQPPFGQQPFAQNPPYNLQNNATTDPYLKEYLDTWRTRMGELRADEGKLRSESDARTKQMISQAEGDITDRAAGAGAALSENLSRRGVAGSGVESKARTGLSEASQRNQARAATDITVAQNNRYEDQRLARQNQQNQFLASGLPAAGAIGQNMLAQQGLGLQQYQAMNNQGNQDLQNWMKFYRQPQQQTYSPSRPGTASNVYQDRLG